MKTYKKLAKNYAENWTKPRLSTEEIDALRGAYEMGFLKAKEMARDWSYQMSDWRGTWIGDKLSLLGEGEEE